MSQDTNISVSSIRSFREFSDILEMTWSSLYISLSAGKLIDGEYLWQTYFSNTPYNIGHDVFFSRDLDYVGCKLTYVI